MPIYEYRCQECGNRAEILVRSLKREQAVCPECGSTEMGKLISAPGAILKSAAKSGGSTCCGRDERCETPPCSSGDGCRRNK
jgi:putative FmdB family regulatory protein